MNVINFKLQLSSKDFTPKLPEWTKGRIFSIDCQEQWDPCLIGKKMFYLWLFIDLYGHPGRQVIQ